MARGGTCQRPCLVTSVTTVTHMPITYGFNRSTIQELEERFRQSEEDRNRRMRLALEARDELRISFDELCARHYDERAVLRPYSVLVAHTSSTSAGNVWWTSPNTRVNIKFKPHDRFRAPLFPAWVTFLRHTAVIEKEAEEKAARRRRQVQVETKAHKQLRWGVVTCTSQKAYNWWAKQTRAFWRGGEHAPGGRKRGCTTNS